MKRNNIQSDLKRMVQKYLAGKASSQEIEFLEEYYDHFENRQDLFENLSETKKNQLEAEIEARIISKIGDKRGNAGSLYIRISIAAAVLIVLSFSFYFFWSQNGNQPILAKNPKVIKNDVAPGGSNAILRLADGTTIVLNEAQNGVLAKQGGIKIKKTANGQVVYDLSAMTSSRDQTSMYNTISTPAGGQYQVVLPDGSRVWLNAMSSLKFPVVFDRKKRAVELSGEGYFEIAKNEKVPFSVMVNGSRVEVLGTHFNVMGYTDEGSTNTTLLEGKVKVVRNGESVIIHPGQQARVTDNIQIEKVDVTDAVAWKNGYFMFKGEKLESIMRKLNRWYNVEVHYKGKIPQNTFVGRISRDKNLSEVIDMLELSAGSDFDIRVENSGDKNMISVIAN